METKHTPGPWSVGYFCDIRANDGYHSLATVSSHYGLPGGANARRIVECVNACEGLADPSVVPELLALMQDVLPILESMDHQREEGDEPMPLIDQVRAAIAKATGKTP